MCLIWCGRLMVQDARLSLSRQLGSNPLRITTLLLSLLVRNRDIICPNRRLYSLFNMLPSTSGHKSPAFHAGVAGSNPAGSTIWPWGQSAEPPACHAGDSGVGTRRGRHTLASFLCLCKCARSRTKASTKVGRLMRSIKNFGTIGQKVQQVQQS